MIVLTKSNNSESFVCTLNENRTITQPNYLFVFSCVTTKRVVKKLFQYSENISEHQDRFDEFLINTASVFSGEQSGQWRYKVYEQSSFSNTDETGLRLLEVGKLLINEEARFGFGGYAPSTQYVGYAG